MMMSNKWYNTAQWRKLRQMVLNEEPLCRMCHKAGRITPADAVDHIKPHGGDWELFISRDNLQALCRECHNTQKQMQEIHGHSQACDDKGMPLDERHPWRKECER